MKHIHILFACLLSLTILNAQQSQFSPLNIEVAEQADDTYIASLLAREFGLNERFSLVKSLERKSPTARYITFEQRFEGKAVQYAGIKVCIDQHNKMRWAMNYLKNNLGEPAKKPEWKVSEQAIRFRLMKQFGTFDVQLAKLFWANEENSLVPVWRCWTFSHGQSESYEVLIHAETGEELMRTDRAMYHSDGNSKTCNHNPRSPFQSPDGRQRTADGDTTGRARIWSPNPVTASGSPYGSLFSDNNDMATAAFEPYIDTVILQDITYDNGQFKLEGPYVTIVDISPVNVAPATSTNGNFYYNRSESGWEDVIVYYHVDKFQRYIQSFGITNLWGDKPLNADPHGRGNNDNSSFIPNGDNSNIGFGDGGVDDAEDADVVIHEYGHALAYAGSPNTSSGTQRRGLDEGFGDFFASIYSFDNNAGGYGWQEVMNWDGHNPFWPGRSSNNNAIYNANERNIYVIGELWASTLMEIRQQIGSDTLDRLQFELLYSLSPNMTVPDAAQTIIDANWMYHNGKHEQLIREVFCRRQIFAGGDCLLTSNKDELGTATWHPINQNDQLSIRWEREPVAWEAQLFDSQGRMVRGFRGEISTTGLARGVYLLKMMVQGKMVSAKKVVL